MSSLAFHPTRPSLLASAGSDGEVYLWDVKKRTKVAAVLQNAAAADAPAVPAVSSLSFARSGDVLAYARSDDWTGGAERHTQLCAAGHKSEVCLVAVPPAAK